MTRLLSDQSIIHQYCCGDILFCTSKKPLKLTSSLIESGALMGIPSVGKSWNMEVFAGVSVVEETYPIMHIASVYFTNSGNGKLEFGLCPDEGRRLLYSDFLKEYSQHSDKELSNNKYYRICFTSPMWATFLDNVRTNYFCDTLDTADIDFIKSKNLKLKTHPRVSGRQIPPIDRLDPTSKSQQPKTPSGKSAAKTPPPLSK